MPGKTGKKKARARPPRPPKKPARSAVPPRPELPGSKPVGRPRKIQRLPVYNSMAECTAFTGIPHWLLKQARLGCPKAFKWGRIDLELLLPWIFADGLKTEDWTAVREKHQALNEKMKHDRAAQMLIEKLPVMKTIHAAEAKLFGAIDRYFLSEFPPRTANKSATQIALIAEKALENLKLTFREDLALLTERNGQARRHS